MSAPPAEDEVPGTPAPGTPPRRRRRWLRWLVRIALALLALLVLLRLLLPFLLPWVANLVLEPQGLRASWRSLELSLLSAHVRLVGVEVRAIAERADGGEDGRAPAPPLAQIADVEVDVDLGALLGGEIVVETARLAGLRARLEQTDDGFTVPGLPAAERAAAPEPAPEPAPAAPAAPATAPPPIDFRLPVQVRLLALHDLRVEIANRATGNLQEWRVEAHAETIGVPGRDGAFSLRAICPSALDRLDVIATVRADQPTLEVDAEASFVGAQPQAFAALLEPAGIEPVARRLDGTASVALSARADDAGERAAIEVSAAVHVHGDDLVVAAVERVAASAVLLRDGSLVDARVEIAGVEAAARIRADGAVVAGGLAFVGGGGSAQEPEPEPAAGPPTVVAFDEILVTDVRARWLDERREPAVDRVVAIPRVEVRSLRIGGEGDAPPATFALALEIPGVLDSLTFDGRADLQPPQLGVDARLAYEGLQLDAAEPLLASFGIATGEGTGRGQLALSAQVVTDPLRAEVHVRELELHGGGETLSIDEVAITDVTFDESAQRLAVGKVAIEGPEANLRATEQGIELLRLRFGGATAAATGAGTAGERTAGERTAAEVAANATDADRAKEPPLRIDVGEITWTGADVTFVDATQSEPLELRLTDLSLSGENWSWGREHGDEDPGRLQLQFSVPGVAERVALRGTVLACDNGTNLDLVLEASGLSIEPVRERLRSPGVEPMLADGRLTLHVAGQVRAEDDALRATVEVTDVDLRDGDTHLLQVQRLAVEGFASSSDLLAIDRVVVQRPELRIGRAENGDLLLPALRLAASQPAPAPAPGSARAETVGGSAAAAAPQQSQGDARPAAAGNGEGSAAGADDGAALRIGEVALVDAQVTFLDAAVEPEVARELVANASLRDLRTGADAQPAPFRVEIASPELLDRLVLDGEVQFADGRTGLTAALDVAGLRGEALSRYLPGLQIALQDGALQARLAATATTREDGAGAVRFELTDLALRDGDGDALLAVEAIRLDAPRIPDDDGLLHIADLAVAGVRGTVRIEPDAIVLPGLRLPRAGAATTGAATTPASTPGGARGGAGTPTAPEAPANGTAAASAPATPPAAAPPLRVPLLQIDRFSLELAALTIVDTTAPPPGDGAAPAGPAAPAKPAEPLQIAATVTLAEPWAMEPREVGETDPLHLEIAARATPVLEDVRIALRLSPFAFEPAARVALRVSGIDTTALHRALPSLAGIADGTLEDGSFTADATAEFLLRRRSPREFPFGQPFGFTARITDVALRAGDAAAGPAQPSPQSGQNGQDGPNGQNAGASPAAAVFAVKSIDVDVSRFDPRTGDLFANLIEVIGLRGSATQTARGIEIAGIVLAPGAAPPRFLAGPPPADAPPPAEIAIDELLVSGLRFTWRDETTKPPTILPLHDLEIDVLRLSSRATQAPRPMEFTISVEGGKVDLARRVLGGSIVGDIVSAAGRAIGGGERTIEQRQLFGDFYVTGALQLYPATVGRVQMNLSALELQSLGGLASAQGIEIGDGLLDVGALLEFARSGLDVDAQATFTHLSVTEPPNGPISRVLNLPAPLDTVLFLLRNDAGELRIPIDFHLPQRGLTARQVFGQVVQTLSSVITRAIAASPFRVAGQVTSFADEITGLFGFRLFGSGPPEDLSQLARAVRFRPGVAAAPEQIEDLQAIVERWDHDENVVLVLEHEFGAEDLEVAELRANPPRVQIEQIATGLRASVARLEAQRSELAAQVRGLYAAGQLWRAEEQAAELRTLDDRLGTAEIALQQALSRLRPGAENKATRRSRAVAIEIAEGRLEAVRAWLAARAVAAGDPAGAARIEVRKPRYREAVLPVGRVVVKPVFRVAR